MPVATRIGHAVPVVDRQYPTRCCQLQVQKDGLHLPVTAPGGAKLVSALMVRTFSLNALLTFPLIEFLWQMVNFLTLTSIIC